MQAPINEAILVVIIQLRNCGLLGLGYADVREEETQSERQRTKNVSDVQAQRAGPEAAEIFVDAHQQILILSLLDVGAQDLRIVLSVITASEPCHERWAYK